MQDSGVKIREHEKDRVTQRQHRSGICLLLRGLWIFVKGQSVKEAKKNMGDVDVNPSREHRSPTNRWMNCALSNDVRRKKEPLLLFPWLYFFNRNGCNCSSSTKVSQCVWPIQRLPVRSGVPRLVLTYTVAQGASPWAGPPEKIKGWSHFQLSSPSQLAALLAQQKVKESRSAAACTWFGFCCRSMGLHSACFLLYPTWSFFTQQKSPMTMEIFLRKFTPRS